MNFNVHKTAISRNKLSLPVRLAIKHGLINKDDSILDYGCGKGKDEEYLQRLGYLDVNGYDPYYRPNGDWKQKYGIVFLNYVLNVIDNPPERITTLYNAYNKASKRLIISVRNKPPRDTRNWKPHKDGWITTIGTFQKFYRHSEILTALQQIFGFDNVCMKLSKSGNIYYINNPQWGLRI